MIRYSVLECKGENEKSGAPRFVIIICTLPSKKVFSGRARSSNTVHHGRPGVMCNMSRKSKAEYIAEKRRAYSTARPEKRSMLIDEVRETLGYSRKYVNKLLTGNIHYLRTNRLRSQRQPETLCPPHREAYPVGRSRTQSGRMSFSSAARILSLFGCLLCFVVCKNCPCDATITGRNDHLTSAHGGTGIDFRLRDSA